MSQQPPPNGDQKILGAIKDAVTYPILTEEVSFPAPAPRTTAAPPVPGAAPLGQIADQAIRDVLGWKWKAGDVKGFLAALNQSFDILQVEGHTQFTWTPKTYAAQLQADMGALTGAQASIYARAQAALTQMLPLLDGLYPLRPDYDQVDIDTMRGIVRSELTGLVGELGLTGGPRVKRVDDYFQQLGGDPWTSTGSSEPVRFEKIGGHLGELRDRFGLDSIWVNTIDQEQDLTNYLILVDYAQTLFSSWRSERPNFTGSAAGTVYLGTQLVLLSRQLSVVAETVQQVYFALDSVWIGPAERATLRFTTDGVAFFLGDLLDWAYRFATEEGIVLLQDGGKDGVFAFRETLDAILAQLGAVIDTARRVLQ